MKRFAAALLLLLLAHQSASQPLSREDRAFPKSASLEQDAIPASRQRIESMKLGSHVTITLVSHRKVSGTLVSRAPQTFVVRTSRGVLGSRLEPYAYFDVVAVRKNMPVWVLPVIVAGVVGGVLIGVGACLASGACRS